VHTIRATGGNVFVILRQSFNTIQCVYSGKKDVAKLMEGVPKESVVDVTATVTAAPVPIASTSQQVCFVTSGSMFLWVCFRPCDAPPSPAEL
jgi:aspartyl/asparaginyl-tRNA synthetase